MATTDAAVADTIQSAAPSVISPELAKSTAGIAPSSSGTASDAVSGVADGAKKLASSTGQVISGLWGKLTGSSTGGRRVRRGVTKMKLDLKRLGRVIATRGGSRRGGPSRHHRKRRSGGRRHRTRRHRR